MKLSLEYWQQPISRVDSTLWLHHKLVFQSTTNFWIYLLKLCYGIISINLKDYLQNNISEAHVSIYDEIGTKSKTTSIGKIHKCIQLGCSPGCESMWEAPREVQVSGEQLGQTMLSPAHWLGAPGLGEAEVRRGAPTWATAIRLDPVFFFF